MSLFLHCRERLVRLVKPALWLIFITGTVILGASMFHEEIATVIVDALGASSKHDALKFGGLALGGVLLVVQAIVADDRSRAMVKQAEAMAIANTNTEIGQRQERLRSAIEHLGHDTETIRLGAVYELYNIANGTDDIQIRREILDIFCSHIRITTTGENYQRAQSNEPSEEVQSILNVLLGARGAVFSGLQIDLSNSFLSGADLFGLRLVNARLNNTNLSNAMLERALLQGANLIHADLSEARMDSANLQGSMLVNAKFCRAVLTSAKMQGAFIEGTNISSADLKDARLEGAGPVGPALKDDSLVFEVRMMSQVGRSTDTSQVAMFDEIRDAITGTYTKEHADLWIKEALTPPVTTQ